MKLLALVTTLLAGGVAGAQFDRIMTGFEPPEYVGSPWGTPLTNGFGGGGQQSWYNPVDGRSDFNVYTYEGNALGIPVNPFDPGEQFIAGRTGPNGAYGCAQLDMSMAGWPWMYNLGYSICAAFLGDVPTADYLGGFSLEPSATARSFTAVATWVDVNNPTSWNALYNVFDADGKPMDEQSPGAAWMNLKLDHWYHLYTQFWLNDNRIHGVRIIDLTTGESWGKSPKGWYLAGGADPSLPLPTALRLSSGGNTASGGNTLAFDNLILFVPEPGLMSLLGLGVFAALGLRRRK
jgi:hypothetical protein